MFDRGVLLMQYCIKYNKFLELGLPEFHERCGNRQREAGQSMQVPGKALRAPTRRVSKTTGRGLPQRTAEGRVMTESIIAKNTERHFARSREPPSQVRFWEAEQTLLRATSHEENGDRSREVEER